MIILILIFCDLFHSPSLVFPLKINSRNLHQGKRNPLPSPRDRGLFKKHGESFSRFYDSMEANLCHPEKTSAVPTLFRYLFFSSPPLFNNIAPVSLLSSLHERFYAGLIRSRHGVKYVVGTSVCARLIRFCAAILQM